MSYFRYFPRINIDIEGNGIYRTVPNLTAFSTILLNQIDSVTYYNYYNIQDGYRPDNVSEDLYGTPDLYWTFFLINDHLNNVYDDWPKGTRFFDKWLRAKYNNLAATTAVTRTFDAPNEIAGKFNVGETVTGQVSNARGFLVAKFPTLGYIEIEHEYGTFRETGESILGVTSEDSIISNGVVPLWLAPHHYIDDATGEPTRRKLRDTTAVSILEFERERETLNSRIRVIKQEVIGEVVLGFEQEMSRL